jgi:hypothetical protein
MEEKVKKARVPATAKSNPAEPIAKETLVAPAKGANEKVTAVAPAKPKATASKAKKATSATPDAAPQKLHAVPANSKAAVTGRSPAEPSPEQIARLAHRFWKERGGHHGAHEQDWFRAERELRGMAS